MIYADAGWGDQNPAAGLVSVNEFRSKTWSAAAAATSVSALIATWPGVRASSLSDRSTKKQEKSAGSSVSLDRNMFEIAKKTKLHIMQNRHENNLNAKSKFFQNRSLLKRL